MPMKLKNVSFDISEIADILNTINADNGKYTKIIIINH